MIKTFWILMIIIAAISGLHARRLIQTTLITGRVTPSSAVNQVWAINGKDSTKTILRDGAFILQLKTGRYKIVIDARPPYKNFVQDGIVADQGKNTDLGEIKLEQ